MDDFEGCYERLYVYAFRAALRVVGEREAARDVASETLARAYSRWRLVAGHSEAWVTRVAINLALDTVRRRRPSLISVPATNREPSPERVVVASELARLPRRQREALVLRYMVDLDEKSSAEVLGITIGTLKTHVARGLSAMRKRLGRDWTFGADA